METIDEIVARTLSTILIILLHLWLIRFILKQYLMRNHHHGGQEGTGDKDRSLLRKISDSLFRGSKIDRKNPPGPWLSLPIVGDLYLLAPHADDPWWAFDQIRVKYGPLVRLRLGSFETILISSLDLMREVLLTKAEYFADRPHFRRHDYYFNMNRQNALALCDWTETHQKRRSIAHAAVIPRFGTDNFTRLSDCCSKNIRILIENLQNLNRSDQNDNLVMEKDQINELCCKIFLEFLLDFDEKSIANTKENGHNFLKNLAYNFDYIFYDINQMNLSDFIPSLQRFKPIRKYLDEIFKKSQWLSGEIGKIVQKRFEMIVAKRKHQRPEESPIGDARTDKIGATNPDNSDIDEILWKTQNQSNVRFLDLIIDHHLEDPEKITWDEMLFEIADLIGGSSAVSNLLFRLIGHLAMNQDVQQEIYDEIQTILSSRPDSDGIVRIEDQAKMPMVFASIMEALRLSLSPIVPHYTRADTSLQEYFVPKGTMILFNIYHFNLSPKFFAEPFRFDPKRFIDSKEKRLRKPSYFFPFSYGRRSCLGYKMVNTILSTTIANLLIHYRLTSIDNGEKIGRLLKPKGTVALPCELNECYHIGLIERC
ncbi:Cytochrome P450 -like protein [Sarcoptes scabiei]|uniref:Cytochrome P450 -like protein n=1 Tax=Sarcoptes scabiei TaxID=52283 RepID=A0A132A601_SARSC|nr:Cytochrome P450 -like protein [Sarcoptes scabiei]KPM06364.1 cytochrome P450-like protein 16 [Sarcoptes scabiei]